MNFAKFPKTPLVAASEGVDLANMLIELHGTKIITKKRWYLKLIFHCSDISKVNAWLLHRRYCKQIKTPKNKQLSFRKFIAQIATVLKLRRQRSIKKDRSSQQGHLAYYDSWQETNNPKPVDDGIYDSTDFGTGLKLGQNKSDIKYQDPDTKFILGGGLIFQEALSYFLSYYLMEISLN